MAEMLPEPDCPLLETRRTRSADGTLVAYYTTSPPRADAPTLVLAGGLAGHHRAWTEQIRYFGDRYRIVTWDYRGLFGSAHPIATATDAYTMSSQLRDLEAVLDAEALTDVGLVGWSMGVQLALEACRSLPERLRCLVLINGVAGRPLDAWARLPALGRPLGRLLSMTVRGRKALRAALRTPARRRQLAHLLRRLGLIAPTVDAAMVERLVADVSDLSFTAFARTLEALAVHDAADVLPAVQIPALVIVGDGDPLTPATVAQAMARRLPNSEILVVPGGRHFVFLEYPELVNLRLEQFFHHAGLA